MKVTERPALQGLGKWVEGREEMGVGLDIHFYAKVFEEGSEYGIDGGKISKLEIRLGNEILCNYDRGWDVEPTEEVKLFYECILARFN